ncbi:MAG: cytochrome c oxidase subunit II [Actinomycetota bacterium]
MRRKGIVVAVLALVVALATAGVADAAYGGFSPQHAHSPGVRHTNTAYWVIFAFTTAIFLIVTSTLVVFIVRFRARGRDRTDEGAQVHGNTRLELLWTVIPVVILAVIGTVVFLELPKITPPAKAATTLEIKVEGHQFYWQFDYPDGSRTINDLYVPVDRDVRLTVVSGDVIHSFWAPQLLGKIQAIPGRTNHTGFKAERVGTYLGACAEICGPFHAKMDLRVIVTDAASYDATLHRHTTVAELGRQEFQGVCATCHGMQGQGGYGPALSSNSILAQKSSLASIITTGRGLMPPVADTWTDEQIGALAQYVKSHVYKGASTSGG